MRQIQSPAQGSKAELFAEIVIRIKPVIVYTKNLKPDTWVLNTLLLLPLLLISKIEMEIRYDVSLKQSIYIITLQYTVLLRSHLLLIVFYFDPLSSLFTFTTLLSMTIFYTNFPTFLSKTMSNFLVSNANSSIINIWFSSWKLRSAVVFTFISFYFCIRDLMMVFPEVWLLNILSSTDLLYIILMQSSPSLMWSLKLNSFFLFSRYILVFQDYWFWNWAEYSHFPNVCFFAISSIFLFWSSNAFDLCSRFCSSPTILNLSLKFHWWFDNC